MKALLHQIHVWKFIDSSGKEHWFQSVYDKGGRFEVYEYIPDRGLVETGVDVGFAIWNKDYKGLIKKKVVEDPNFGKPPGWTPAKPPRLQPWQGGSASGKKKRKHGAPALAYRPVMPPQMRPDPYGPIQYHAATPGTFDPVGAEYARMHANDAWNAYIDQLAKNAATGGYVGGGYTIAQTDLPPPSQTKPPPSQTKPPPSQTKPPPVLNPIQFSGLADLAGPHHGHHHHHGGGGGWGWGGGPWQYGYVSPYLVVDDIDKWVAQPGVIEEERKKCLAEKHTWDAQTARCIG
jgi:hypothetical protein